MPMLGGVPAVRTDVAAAAEGDRIIDDDDLLVVGGPQRQGPVQSKIDPRTVKEAAAAQRKEPLGGRDRKGRLPAQDADLQVRTRLGQGPQERADLLGHRALAGGVVVQNRVRIEGPVQEMDRPGGSGHGGLGRREIGLHVHEQGRTGRGLHAPAGRSGLKHPVSPFDIRPLAPDGDRFGSASRRSFRA